MLNIKLIKAFSDNYFFLLSCNETGETAVVDPGDSTPVIDALNGKHLDKIIITHHHHDHIGGVHELVQKYGCDVIAYNGDKQRIPCVTTTVESGGVITIGNVNAKILFIPGHTSGHIAYYFIDDKALFCGDTLFVAGCGRLFEGTAEQMFNSLVKLKSLPDDTAVYCAHEYTLSNLEFAHHVLPEDEFIADSLALVKKQRLEGLSTVPSTIAAEKKHNIFMRAKNVEKFANLRRLKDSF